MSADDQITRRNRWVVANPLLTDEEAAHYGMPTEGEPEPWDIDGASVVVLLMGGMRNRMTIPDEWLREVPS